VGLYTDEAGQVGQVSIGALMVEMVDVRSYDGWIYRGGGDGILYCSLLGTGEIDFSLLGIALGSRFVCFSTFTWTREE
jgi:hypothetical protein